MVGTKVGLAALVGLMGAAAWTPASAGTNLIVNGSFAEETINGAPATSSDQLVSPSDNYSNAAVVTGWLNAGYTFLFVPDATKASGTTADTTGATSPENGNAALKLWGPGTGQANGLTQSPDGNNFIASDGAYQRGAISQAVNNLVIGNNYFLSFYWAAAQQQGFTGATTEGWDVSFGGTTYSTPTVSTASQGFSPWRQQTFSFQATALSQTLSFLATGAPSGLPPFSLLDGVSLQVPEPATWAIVMLGVVGAGAMSLHRRRRGAAKAAAA